MGQAVRDQLFITSGNGLAGSTSNAFAGPPMSGTVLVGGGASITNPASKHVLYKSRPRLRAGSGPDTLGWEAASKDHTALPTVPGKLLLSRSGSPSARRDSSVAS